MNEERPSVFVRLGRLIDGLRRFLINVLFFGLAAGLLIASLSGRIKVPDGAALVLNPRGTIVEQLSAVDPVRARGRERHGRRVGRGRDAAQGPGRRAEARQGRRAHQGRLPRHERDVRRRLHEAAGPARGAPRLQEERQEGDRLRRRLRPAAVLPRGAGRRGLPAPRGHGADRGLRPRAQLLQGGPRQASAIEVHVFRVGEYKSAVEPYLRDDMSKEAKEMALDFYGDLWRDWLADVARGAQDRARRHRGGDRGAARSAARGPRRHGRWLAKEAKLVDTLAPRDEVRKRLIALTGEDKEKHSFKQIGLRRLPEVEGRRPDGRDGPRQRRRGGGRQGHDPRRHAARGHDRRRLHGAAHAPGARGRRT